MTIVNCPQCQEQVTAPAGVHADAVVRCPLCRAEYPLERILAQQPPALIVVRAAAPAEDRIPTAHDAVAWSQPLTSGSSEEYALAPPAEATEVDAAPFSFAPSRAAPAPKRDTRTKPRSRSGGPLRQLVQVAFGGVVGIALAQVILWWIPVELSLDTRDLTGLGRRYGHYMPFLVPAAVREPAPRSGVAEAQASRAKSPAQLTAPAEKQVSRVSKDTKADLPAPAREQTQAESEPLPASQEEPAPPDVGQVSQPAPTETPAPAETPAPGEAASPSLLPTVPGNQVAEKFGAAKAATAALDAAVNPDKTERRRLVAGFYSSLAELGEALALSDPADETVRELTLDTLSLLGRIAKQRERITLIETVTPSWLDNPRAQTGVCLAGSLRSVKPAGTLFEMQLQLDDGRVVTLLNRHDPTGQLPPNSRILVLGARVDAPARNVAGYEGAAAEVVISGLYISL